MFDGVGFGEWLVIAVIALLVVGPKELPKLLKTVGQFTRKMRMMADEFKNNFEDIARQTEIDELRKEIDQLRDANPINTIRDELAGAVKQGEDYYNSKPPALENTSENPDGKKTNNAVQDTGLDIGKTQDVSSEVVHFDDDYASNHNKAILEQEKAQEGGLSKTVDNSKISNSTAEDKGAVNDKSA